MACVAVVIRIDDETIELKNIATKEVYREQGYGKKMLKYLADNYDEEIIDGDLHCIDMYYYSKDLKK